MFERLAAWSQRAGYAVDEADFEPSTRDARCMGETYVEPSVGAERLHHGIIRRPKPACLWTRTVSGDEGQAEWTGRCHVPAPADHANLSHCALKARSFFDWRD